MRRSYVIVLIMIPYLVSCSLSISTPQSTQWQILFPDEEWNEFPEDELKDFVGTVIYDPNDPNPPFVERYNPYKLMTSSDDVIDIYCGSSHI